MTASMIEIDRDMPGGNGELLAFDAARSTLVLRPEPKGGSPYRAWFFMRLRNLVPGQTYTIKVVENRWAGVYSYSYRRCGPWQHFTDYRQDNETDYSFRFTPTEDTLHVAMMEPYLLSHLDRLIADTSNASESLVVSDFWISEEGRTGKLFRIGDPVADHRVWITARMHAFEAVSSRAADGLVRWALSADPVAQWIVRNACLYVIPMVDIDSVYNGGTGKYRAPICFARDARSNPHWNAIKALVREWEQQGPPDLFLDIHGPGGECRDVYFYAPQTPYTTPAYEHDLTRFLHLLSGTLPEAMRYEQRVYRCPYGPDGQGQDMAGTSYFYLHQRYFGQSRLGLSLGVETPWSDPAYTTDIAAQCGAGYVKAISLLLQGVAAV